jgi:hypothetical protein
VSLAYSALNDAIGSVAHGRPDEHNDDPQSSWSFIFDLASGHYRGVADVLIRGLSREPHYRKSAIHSGRKHEHRK